jgi:hypothetical protein
VDPIDTTHEEWQRPAEFGDAEAATCVAALWDVDELDEWVRRAH